MDAAAAAFLPPAPLAGLLLLMLFTAMEPILFIELFNEVNADMSLLLSLVVTVVCADGEFARKPVVLGGTVVPSLSLLEILGDPLTDDDDDVVPTVFEPLVFSSFTSSPECLCSQAFFNLCPPYVGGLGLLDFSLSIADVDTLAGVVFGLLHGGGGACKVAATATVAVVASSGNVADDAVAVVAVAVATAAQVDVVVSDDDTAMDRAGGGGVLGCTFITVVVTIGVVVAAALTLLFC